MKKTILLFLAMTLIFSTLCGVTVMADELPELARISLSKNTSYYSEAVPEGTKLIVTGLDKNGEEADVSDMTFTYESTRPWVLDVDENGNIIDGGHDGTTIITAKTENNLEASLFFIRGVEGDYNMSFGMEQGGKTHASAVGGLQVMLTNNGLSNSTYVAGNEADANARIAGKDYYIKTADTAETNYNNHFDYALNAGYRPGNGDYDTASWTKAGLRVFQGWFYDDCKSALRFGWYMAENANYLDTTIRQNLGTKDKDHMAWQAYITASASDETYTQLYASDVINNTENSINRSEGWHQATAILNDDATVDVYIDGELFSTSKIAARYGNNMLSIASQSAGRFDDMVLAANPNTTKPDDYIMPAIGITLSKNTSFLTTVDESKSLIVTPVDKNGDETELDDVTYTYESTHPWVLDISEDGKFIDGGYEGSTIVTVKASNEMEASLVFIKGNLNGLNNHTEALGVRSSFSAGSGNMWRTYTGATYADATEVATGGHDGGNYYQKNKTTGVGAADYAVAIRYGRGSWDNEAQIRIAQGWFYDDGVSELNIYLQAAQKDPEEYSVGSGVTEAQLASWREWGLDPDLVKARPTDNYTDSFRWNGQIVAAAGDSVYTKDDLGTKTETAFERTKGWHQATMILNEDGSINVYLDGQEFLVSHIVEGSSDSQFMILGSTMGKYDDFVLTQNSNDTKPTVDISVSYDEAQGSVSCNNSVIANGGKAEAYYDDSVNFTFEPKAGFKLDSVIYDGINVTDFIKNGVLNVDCKNAELVVTFKEIPVEAPSVSKTMEIKTDQKVDGNPAALMYMQIQPGYGYTVTESGIVLSDKENDAQNGMKLVAKNTDNTNVTSGLFGIRVYGSALNGINCYFNPFVKYQNGEEIKTVYGDQDSFTLNQ